MYRFLQPHADGTVTDIAIGAPHLADAFRQFSESWWVFFGPGAIAVFQNAALQARIVPVMDRDTGESMPHIQLWR